MIYLKLSEPLSSGLLQRSLRSLQPVPWLQRNGRQRSSLPVKACRKSTRYSRAWEIWIVSTTMKRWLFSNEVRWSESLRVPSSLGLTTPLCSKSSSTVMLAMRILWLVKPWEVTWVGCIQARVTLMHERYKGGRSAPLIESCFVCLKSSTPRCTERTYHWTELKSEDSSATYGQESSRENSFKVTWETSSDEHQKSLKDPTDWLPYGLTFVTLSHRGVRRWEKDFKKRLLVSSSSSSSSSSNWQHWDTRNHHPSLSQLSEIKPSFFSLYNKTSDSKPNRSRPVRMSNT